jgi:porin
MVLLAHGLALAQPVDVPPTLGRRLLGGALVPVNVATLVPDLGEAATGTNLIITQFLSPKFGLVAGKIFCSTASRGVLRRVPHPVHEHRAELPHDRRDGPTLRHPDDWLLLSALAVDPSGTVMNNDVSEAFDDGAMVITSAKVSIKPFGLRGTQSVGGIWSNKSHLSLQQDPSNIAPLLAEERFPRLADPGRLLTRILQRFRSDLLTPTQPPKREDTTWFVYYSFEQYFWHPGVDQTRGIGMFFNFGTSEGKANPIKYSFITGIGGKGVVPGRPHDTFGVGWARTEVSGNFVSVPPRHLRSGLRPRGHRRDVLQCRGHVMAQRESRSPGDPSDYQEDGGLGRSSEGHRYRGRGRHAHVRQVLIIRSTGSRP